MRIGRAKNDLEWNYGIAFEQDVSRGEGYVLAIWFFRQIRRTPKESQVLAPIVGFNKRIHLF